MRQVVLEAGKDGHPLPLPGAVLLDGLVRAGHVSDLYFDHGTKLVVVAVPENDVLEWATAAAETVSESPAFVYELAREPDVYSAAGDTAIWYGPYGPEGDCATEVGYGGGRYFNVAEYQDVAGCIENYDKDRPFRRLSASVNAAGFRSAYFVGKDYMDEHGSDEEMVESLP